MDYYKKRDKSNCNSVKIPTNLLLVEVQTNLLHDYNYGSKEA